MQPLVALGSAQDIRASEAEMFRIDGNRSLKRNCS